jgi:crotonobetainyl-CoA:carnitine CoA-transferase CaiB-like acyl-CoA transferase
MKPILSHRLGTAPLLGQDTDWVLSELLGLTAKEPEALHARGVIEPVKT